MAANYWDNTGGVANDGNDPANWSLGTVPAGTDVATFDNTSDDNCTFTDNISCAGINVTSDYDGDVDLGANTFTIGSDGIILDGAGDFDWGGATVGITGGTLDVVDQATTTVGTASITLNGTCVLKGHNAKTFYDLTIPNGSTTTVHGDTVARAVVVGTCTISGAVVVSDVLAVTGDGDFVINSTASLTGGAYLYLIGCNSGHGITTLQAGASVACQVVVYNSVAGTVLAAGTYAGDVVLFGTSGNTTTLELSNGTYTFDGGLELWMNHATATINLDNVTNAPTINVTNLTIDGDAAGTINIDDSAGSAVAWNITGNIVDEIGTATFNYTKNANGGGWYLSSSNNQTIDFLGEDIGVIRDIDKSAGGTVTLENVTAELGTITALTDGLTIGTGATTTSDGAKAISTTLDMSAATSVNLGSDTWTLTDCDFDYNGIGTLTDGTSTVVFEGTCTLNGDTAAKGLRTATVNASAVVTVTANTEFDGVLTLNGELSVNSGVTVFVDCATASQLDINAGGSLTGRGLMQVSRSGWSASSRGINTMNGSVTIAQVNIRDPEATAVIARATYNCGKFYVYSDEAGDNEWTVASGTYTFGGDVEFATTGAGDELIIDMAANDPNFIIGGDLLFTESGEDIDYQTGDGAVTFGRTPFAKLSGSCEFDGAADLVNVGAQLVTTGAASFSMWIYARSASGSPRLFSNDKFAAIVNTAGGVALSRDGATFNAKTANSVIPTNTWVHVAGTSTSASPSVINLYINGVLSGDADQTDGGNPTSPGSNLFVGDRPSSGKHFDGYIDDLRIFNHVITSGEIATLYNNGAGTATALDDELLWYKFDEYAASTAVTDSGSGGNNGTAVRNRNLTNPAYKQITTLGETLEQTTFNGTGDTWELQDKLTAESITHTAGTLDVNGQDLETTVGDFEVAGSALLTANGTLGSTITTAGATRIYGDAGALRDLDPGEAWTLTSTGPAVIYYATVGDLDASGSTDDARAYDSIDAGSNTNVVFVSIGIVAGIAENPGEMAFAAEDIMSGAASEMYKMTPNVVDVTSEKHDTDALSHVIYKLMCGTAGDIKVKFADGSTVTMPNVAAGFVHILPAPVSQVFSTDTGALEMFGFY